MFMRSSYKSKLKLCYYSARSLYSVRNPYEYLKRKIEETCADNPSLKPIAKKDVVIKENNFTWLVNVATNLKKKPVFKESDGWEGVPQKKDDPFMPPLEENLIVEHNFTRKHTLILNKFPIADKHALVITKDFESQLTPLDYEDIEACLIAMRAQDPGFIFFNCGKISGASQPHKHMQVFPQDNFTYTGGEIPLTVAMEECKKDTSKPFYFPDFDFKHEIRFFHKDIFTLIDEGNLEIATEYVLRIYQGKELITFIEMTKSLGLEKDVPFNFNLTKDYLFMVPRSKERFRDIISLNSLCFIGTFFVSDEERLQLIQEAGPLEVLKEVTFPKK
ncbi:unnamed protein product [Moneuplotes crassus]|uniref:ATP adenylyltransferase n=1 Tax=Euplotes crassus TaxID=5936 RepID=A0AAD1XJN8_EUPCR|nr:unnamed protein product [Moneuplotes crassus]